MDIGEPIKGELHQTSLTTATQIPIYKVGSLSAYTLKADEYIVIESISVITSVSSDVAVFLSLNSTLDAGEVVIRGTYAATGGEVQPNINIAGAVTAVPYVQSGTSSTVDVILKGWIRSESNSPRPNWRESLVPGQ